MSGKQEPAESLPYIVAFRVEKQWKAMRQGLAELRAARSHCLESDKMRIFEKLEACREALQEACLMMLGREVEEKEEERKPARASKPKTATVSPAPSSAGLGGSGVQPWKPGST